MKIENQSEEFELIHDSKTHMVPSGVFEVTDNALGQYIIAKGKRWGKTVIKLGETKNEDIKSIDITPIKKKETKTEDKQVEEKRDVPVEEVKEEVKETPKKKKKANKSSKTQELEKDL